MAGTFRKFLRENIDLSPFGIDCDNTGYDYFCTPKGAKIVGWTGVDGIHYCLIRGFGEMVFAISPMNTAGNYVHPVAENFADFLRLLITCGGEAALEQVWAWNQEQFDDFLRDNQVTEEQKRVADVIREQMRLVPMDAPFVYIKKIQEAFDYTKIKYTEDFYDPDMNPNAEPELPEWKVYFEGDFRGYRGRERAGMEIAIGREFYWGGNRWLVPAVYSCSKGLVVDFCIQIPAERIQAFIDKWNLSIENDNCSLFTHEQQMQMDAENPMSVDVRYEAVVNGKELQESHGYGISWNPCVPEGAAREVEAQAVVEHYGLDPADGWVIWRQCFRWETKRRTKMKSLSVKLKQNRIAVPGPRFHVAAPGDCVEFVHPSTGQTHVLTVQEYEQQEMPKRSFEHLPDMEFPTHYTVMSYAITLDLPDGVMTIQDCAECDSPRMKKRNPIEPEAHSSFACIGIIGGAHGPTAIICGSTIQGQLRAACSSPHFEPVEDVEWRMIFYKKTLEDMVVDINIDV